MKMFLFTLLVLLVGSAQAEVIFKTGFEPLFFVGGTSTDADVEIQLNQNPNFILMQSGSYVFPTALEAGDSYVVNVINSPPNKTCGVENPSGIGNQTDITDVNITCGTTTTIYDVKQSISTGLVGIDDVQIISCWPGRGLTAQTLPADADYQGDDYSGVYIFDNTTHCSDGNQKPQVGDRVNLVAVADDFFGQIQLSNPLYTVISSNHSAPAPVVSSTSALGTITSAPLEAVLVQVNNATVTDIDVPAGIGDTDPTHEYIVTDDMSSELKVDDLLYLTTPFPAVNDVFPTITGILTFRNQSSKLLPRFSPDAFIADSMADNLVINEVDYDQFETDEMEFLEIFNPTDQTISLTDKTIYLVNGSNDNEYLRVDLDTDIEILSGQYLVVGSQVVLDAFANGSIEVPFADLSDNIQNGPDGILLIDRQTLVVEDALSYEGSITAEITDLGGLMVNLVEGVATAEMDENNGQVALARIPNGVDSDDAQTDWLAVADTSPGEANNNVTAAPAGLVINEIDYDQPMTDNDEFIEILNTSGQSIALDGVSLYLVNQSSAVYLNIDLSGILLAAGEYLVIGSGTVIGTLPVGTQSVAFASPSNNIQNGSADGILLFDDVNSVALDALSYEGSLTAVDINGTVVSLVEGNAAAAEDNNNITGSLIRFPNGADTNDADTDWESSANITPGAENLQ